MDRLYINEGEAMTFKDKEKEIEELIDDEEIYKNFSSINVSGDTYLEAELSETCESIAMIYRKNKVHLYNSFLNSLTIENTTAILDLMKKIKRIMDGE